MMRIVMAALLLGAVACGGGQTAVVGNQGMGATNVVYPEQGRVPEGTTLWVRLDQKLSAKRNSPGDGFHARVAQDVRSPDGEVLIPRDARVFGHVSAVQREYEGEQAVIVLELDSIEMAGVRQPLRGHITATDVPSSRDRIKGRDVGLGAAAGAVVGGLVHGWSGALVGGALGAAAGGAISLGRSGGEESLPKGTKLALELDRPVQSFAMIRGGRYY
jgi:hypothetical protein